MQNKRIKKINIIFQFFDILKISNLHIVVNLRAKIRYVRSTTFLKGNTIFT